MPALSSTGSDREPVERSQGEGSDDDRLEELGRLADTAGAEVVGMMTQRRKAIHPGTYIGHGKVEELIRPVVLSGNVFDTLKRIDAIGNDLEFRGAVASPTLRIDGMMIAGS